MCKTKGQDGARNLFPVVTVLPKAHCINTSSWVLLDVWLTSVGYAHDAESVHSRKLVLARAEEQTP